MHVCIDIEIKTHAHIYSHGFWTANFLDSLCMWIHISIVTLLRSLSVWIYKRFVWEKLQVLGMYVILWNEKVYNHNLSCSKMFKKHQAYMIVLSLDMALCISLICIEKKCTQMPLAQCITHTLFKITLYNIIQHFIALSHNIICIL